MLFDGYLHHLNFSISIFLESYLLLIFSLCLAFSVFIFGVNLVFIYLFNCLSIYTFLKFFSPLSNLVTLHQIVLDEGKKVVTVDREVDGGLETLCLDLPAVIS